MKIKTSELTGAALDWAVAKCEGKEVNVHSAAMIIKRRLQVLTQEEADTLSPPKPYLVVPGVGNAAYSTDWAQGGPIIEREMITLQPVVRPDGWVARTQKCDSVWEGQYPLIAAMRCYVASKLGDDVEIPDELC